MTPFQVFFKNKPNLAGLQEFSGKVWVHTTVGSKLDGRSQVGHCIYWPEKWSVSIEQSVKFKTDCDVFMPISTSLEEETVPIASTSTSKTPIIKQLTALAPPTALAPLALTTSHSSISDHLDETSSMYLLIKVAQGIFVQNQQQLNAFVLEREWLVIFPVREVNFQKESRSLNPLVLLNIYNFDFCYKPSSNQFPYWLWQL